MPKAKNLAELYDLPTMDWEPVQKALETGVSQAPGTGGPNRHTFWLTTLNEDGSPHVTGFGASDWIDGGIYLVAGEQTRKAQNIARDPRCAVSVAADEFDVVLEGTAEKVTDPAVVADVAKRSAEGGWPAKVDESGTAITAEYSAPSAGPPPWAVYRITPRRATALWVEEPGGATRWDF
jgi:hypothetical protein